MGKKRVLLVDDEQDLLRLLKLNLERTGSYEVKLEENATQALITARLFKPDIILLDVMMPLMNGDEVARGLKADEQLKGVPIVFLTASLTKQDKEQHKRAFGDSPILSKPMTPEQVIACIERCLPAS